MGKRLAAADSEPCVGCQSCMFAWVRRKGEGGLADARIYVRSDEVIGRASSSSVGRVRTRSAGSLREGGDSFGMTSNRRIAP